MKLGKYAKNTTNSPAITLSSAPDFISHHKAMTRGDTTGGKPSPEAMATAEANTETKPETTDPFVMKHNSP